MSDAKPESPPAPAMLRQEGPHKVTVAPGGHSALSSNVGLGTKRLRPAVGAAPVPTPLSSDGPGLSPASLRTRGPASGGSVTEVRRLPGRAPVSGRFLPGQAEPSSAPRDDRAAALEKRLAALAEFNARTSRTVTALEREVNPPAVEAMANPDNPPTEQEPAGLRRLFTRRSS